MLILQTKKCSKWLHDFSLVISKQKTYCVIFCQDFPRCQESITVFRKREFLMKQELKEFQFVVSLPKKRSKVSVDNPYWEKRLTESQETLLQIHDMTNWVDVELTQGYKTPKGITKEIFWKLPSTQEKKDTCGEFKTLGCFNFSSHPNNQALIQHTKLSCFRSACEYCWLEKMAS